MKGPAVLADVVIGPHSCLTEWLFDLVTRINAVQGGRPIRQTNRLDVVDFLSDPRPICLSYYPSPSLIAAIAAGDVRTILVVEDPIDVALFQQQALGLPLLDSIRQQTASAIANLAIGEADHVHYLHRSTQRTVGKLVVDVCRHLMLKADEVQLQDAIATMTKGLGPAATLENALAASARSYRPPVRLEPGSSIDPAMMIAAEVIAPLIAMGKGDTTRPIVWPTGVFIFKDRPDAPAPQTAEIAGPVRDLYYGPYFYLPPANYRVEAILGFSDEIRDVPFVLELHGAAWLARARIGGRKAGNYRGYFTFGHTEPTSTVEIRLRNDRGVAKGRLSLIELLFFPLRDTESSLT